MSSATAPLDLIVIGAGPAGLAAAGVAAGAGLSVMLLDEQPSAGGQVWRNAGAILADQGPRRIFAAGYHRAERALKRLAGSGARHHAGATLVDIAQDEDGFAISWLRRDAGHAPALQNSIARNVIIACGAQERAMVFPGSHRPGVMGIGALQIAMKQAGLVPACDGVILAGQGPLLLLALAQIRSLGGRVSAILDMTPPGTRRRAIRHLPAALLSDPGLVAQGMMLSLRRRMSGIPVYRHVTDLRAEGDDDGALARVRFRAGDRDMSLPATLLAVHDGVIPNTQISRLLGLEHRWNAAQAAFAPVVSEDGESALPGLWIAGDAAGIGGAELAGITGSLAGHAVASRRVADHAGTHRETVARLWRLRRKKRAVRPLVDALYPALPPPGPDADEAVLCRCEAVTVAAIRRAMELGANGPNRVKTFTRCGMGPCQGRICANPLTRLVAQETGATADATGALRIRAPLKPVLLRDYLEQPEAAHEG